MYPRRDFKSPKIVLISIDRVCDLLVKPIDHTRVLHSRMRLVASEMFLDVVIVDTLTLAGCRKWAGL